MFTISGNAALHSLEGSDMVQFLSRFSVRSQVSSIAALGVLALLGAGGVLSVMRFEQDQLQHELNEVTVADRAAGKVAGTLESARNTANLFFAQRREPLLDQRRAALAETQTALGLLPGLGCPVKWGSEPQLFGTCWEPTTPSSPRSCR